MTDLAIDFGKHLPGCTPGERCAVCDITEELKRNLGEGRYTEFLRRVRSLNPGSEPAAAPEERTVDLDLTVDATLGGALSHRIRNGLKNDNIKTLRDLVSKTEAELLRIPNFGRQSLNELKSVLSSIDLRLGSHPLA